MFYASFTYLTINRYVFYACNLLELYFLTMLNKIDTNKFHINLQKSYVLRLHYLKCRKKTESENPKSWEYKDFPRRTTSDIVLRDRSFNIPKNPKYDEYKRGPALMVYNFIDKKYSGGTINTEIISNEQLAEELHKPIIKKCEKQKSVFVY